MFRSTRTIYAVDDEEDLLDIYTAVLGQSFQVKVFKSAESLLTAFTAGASVPDLFLVDLTMPKISGVELIRDLRGMGIYKPVIFVSGHTDGSIIARFLEFLPAFFLEKPFTVELFKLTIRNAIASTIEQSLREKVRAGLGSGAGVQEVLQMLHDGEAELHQVKQF